MKRSDFFKGLAALFIAPKIISGVSTNEEMPKMIEFNANEKRELLGCDIHFRDLIPSQPYSTELFVKYK